MRGIKKPPRLTKAADKRPFDIEEAPHRLMSATAPFLKGGIV